jgi:hypothetical protein
MIPQYSYIPGYTCPAGWSRVTAFAGTPAAPTRAVTGHAILPVLRHTFQESIDKIDVTNVLTAGIQGLITGIFRGSFTMTLYQSLEQTRHEGVLDPHEPYTNPTPGTDFPLDWPATVADMFLIAGSHGFMRHFSTPIHGIEIPCTIFTVDDVVELNAANEVTVTAEINANIGALTYF